MERFPLQSRALASAGYDAETQTLELEFTSGRIYRYEGVPLGTYQWLLRAPNKGGFVARMINDRHPGHEVTSGAGEQDLAAALRASLLALAARQD